MKRKLTDNFGINDAWSFIAELRKNHLLITLCLMSVVAFLFYIFSGSYSDYFTTEICIAITSILFYFSYKNKMASYHRLLCRLDNTLDIITDGFFEVDEEFKVLHCNKRAEYWLNVKLNDIKGKNLWDCFPEAIDTPFYSTYQTVMSERVPAEVQVFYSPLAAHLYARAFPVDEGGIVIYFTDETERVRRDDEIRQHQRISALGKLTGGVAHDFNNALQVINGMSEVLCEKLSNDAESMHHLMLIRQAGQRSAHLTQQLLSFSRRQNLSPTSININHHVDSLRPMLESTIGESIDLYVSAYKEDLFSYVDTHELDNAILNLAINARDAMPDGGTLTIAISVQYIGTADAESYEIEEGRFINIDISDTGTGIPEDVRQHILEPFYTTKSDGKGTGLGLAAVYGFIRQSKGHLLLQSEVGKGSTFRLMLPYHNISEEKSSIEEKGLPTVNGNGQHVLLVEDDQRVSNYIVLILESLGYNVTAVGDANLAIGEARLRRNEKTSFQLIIIDIVLSDGQVGSELLTYFRNNFWPNVPAIMISGHSYDRIASDILEDSNTSFLAKPFSKNELIRKISSITKA